MNNLRFREQVTKLGNVLILLCLLISNAGSVQIAQAAADDTTRVSISSSGIEGNSWSDSPAISSDGRYVAFYSAANNLVDGDTNGDKDVFLHDRLTGQTSLISVDSNGIQGNGISGSPSISADGRYVAFPSGASNLVPNDMNGAGDNFVHDIQTGLTEIISVDTNGVPAGGGGGWSALSVDGRYVAFASHANNLVPGDTNETSDVFVRDRQAGITTRVSVNSGGVQGNGSSGDNPIFISADGRFIAFVSSADNLVSGDTNGVSDVFVHDIQTHITSRVSVSSSSIQGNGESYNSSMSADGRYVTFQSWSSNLVVDDTNGTYDVFVRDRLTNQTMRVSVDSIGTQANKQSGAPVISADGRFISFFSEATNLVIGDHNNCSDIFLHDLQTGVTKRISIASNSIEGNAESIWGLSISSDGRYVAFRSHASNLVSGDTNFEFDIFVHENAITPIAPWTVMVYLDGDNNLDSNYFNVFNQLENAANNPDVNIVVTWDRLGNNNSTYYKVNYDTNLTQLATYTEGVDRWAKGELNMGTSSTLSDFIQWARTNYPAQHYALLISDHGNGLNGTARDQTSGNDWITIKELGDAFSTATSNGSNKLDIVFADSCLMGMIETEYQIRNYANIYIGSENLTWIPGDGSRPYTNYISGITASTTPQDLAAHIITEYSNWIDDVYPARIGYTMSAVDLTKINSLVTNIGTLSTLLKAQLPTYTTQINSARSAVQKFDSNSNESIVLSDEYVDLADLASEFKQKIPDTGIQNAAQAVIDEVNSYVIANISKSGNEVFPSPALNPNRVHGVSIFFPAGNFQRSFYNGLNLEFASDTIWNLQQSNLALAANDSSSGWGSFLVDYVSSINPSAPDDPNPPDLAVPLSSISPLVNFIYRSNVNPASAASVNFAVAFSEPVTEVTTDDFDLYTTGVRGAAITGVSGTGTTYTVTVNTGSGNGTIRLDVLDDDSIKDAANNPLGGIGSGNGNFTSGEVYNINKTPTATFTPTNTPSPTLTFTPTATNTLIPSMTSTRVIPTPRPFMRSAVLTPASLVTQYGTTSGSISSLGAFDQSGVEDNPAAYVSFQTPDSLYFGYQSFYLPSDVRPLLTSTMLLQVNFKGPASSTQIWTWSVYDWNTNLWIKLGDTVGVNADQWQTLLFRIRQPWRYISSGREIRIQLRSNNANSDAKVDYEAIHITYLHIPINPTSVVPTVTPRRPGISFAPNYVPTATPSPMLNP